MTELPPHTAHWQIYILFLTLPHEMDGIISVSQVTKQRFGEEPKALRGHTDCRSRTQPSDGLAPECIPPLPSLQSCLASPG